MPVNLGEVQPQIFSLDSPVPVVEPVLAYLCCCVYILSFSPSQSVISALAKLAE